jgi:hypothetical protein
MGGGVLAVPLKLRSLSLKTDDNVLVEYNYTSRESEPAMAEPMLILL